MDIVIGIGNALRGDDGIGPGVVDAILPRAGLKTMTVHQLVPELAEKIRAARRVLFVDASLDGGGLRLAQLGPSVHRGIGHACSPAALLAWTSLVYDRAPQSWLLTIPGFSFEFGEDVSPQAAATLPEAMARVESWLSDCPEPVLMMSEEEA
jgi:hydrogenase maturation protease